MSVEIKNLPFIGGTTQSIEGDFYTKVANSVLECPHKIYKAEVDSTNLPAPTDASWAEITTQADIDKIKIQDGTVLTYSTLTSGKSMGLLIMYDFANICNGLFGGSNLATKTALQKILGDIFATASGSNNSVVGNDVAVRVYINGAWSDSYKVDNPTANIADIISNIATQVDAQNALTSDNKIYVLIYSAYPSDGTIPSTLSLDYAHIKVDFAKVADVLKPLPPIYLTNTWSIVGEFAPNWDSNNWNPMDWGDILKIYKDSNNVFDLNTTTLSNKCLNMVKTINNVIISNVITLPLVFSKFQLFRFLICQTIDEMRLYLLINNQVISKRIGTTTDLLTGLCNIFLGHNKGGANQCNSFINYFKYLPNYVPADDSVAEDILRGNVAGKASGYEFPNLIPDFKDSRWALNPNTTVSVDGKTLTLNTTQQWQNSYVKTSVLPNNRYILSGNIVGSINHDDAYVHIVEYYNNILIKTTYNALESIKPQYEIITSPYTNNIQLSLINKVAGTFMFSNLSLCIKM